MIIADFSEWGIGCRCAAVGGGVRKSERTVDEVFGGLRPDDWGGAKITKLRVDRAVVPPFFAALFKR